ncbi:MAG: SH3 domain-containing protein, partial [Clostridium sp.]|nr:SH3 domain-containing protein [Clostridium sp.]
MINIRLKKTIVAAILASMLTTASVYTTSNLLQVNAAEADGELTVLAQSLWTYSKADWNARTKIVNSGEKFTLFEKVVIAGREMYGLTNGLYITANPKYISTNESLSVSKPASVPSTYSMTLYNLNLRKGIGTSQGIITTMPKGSKVQILQTKDGWSELRYNGVTGWASSQFLGNTASEPAPPKVETLPSNNTIKVTTAKPKYISTNESLSVSKPASVPSTYSMTLYNLNLRKGIGTSQ